MTTVSAPTYKWTVEEWHRLGEAGIFGEDDRVELLNGEIINMHAIGKRHAQAVTNLNADLAEQARRRFMVSPQNPVELDEMSEPQPDIVLIPWRKKAGETHPLPEDVFLVIEVADSSLRYDRRDKMQAYAKAGIREFWIFNLEDNVIEVFRLPASDCFEETFQVGAGEKLSPLAFPDVVLAIDELVP